MAVPGLSGVTSVAAGAFHTCAAKADETATCWGRNSDGQLGNGTFTASNSPVSVTGLTGVSSVGAGSWHSCAVTASGATSCWGLNDNGRLGDGTSTKRNAPVEVKYPNPIVR